MPSTGTKRKARRVQVRWGGYDRYLVYTILDYAQGAVGSPQAEELYTYSDRHIQRRPP